MRASVAVETSCTMRVLFISAAILACATAAPSGGLLPIVASAVLSPAVPTIPPGDLQAAAIDAKVAIEDQAQIIADQAILLADQAKQQAELAIEEQNLKINEATELAKEKNEEAVWDVEEQKWQALETENTSEAQKDGAVASIAPEFAKSAFAGAVISAPIITPFGSPILYVSPGIVAPIAKSAAQSEAKPEAEKSEDVKVKTEIPEIITENAAEVTTEVPIEAVSTEKTKAEEPALVDDKQSAVSQNAAIVAFSQSYTFANPWPISPITYFQPGVQPLPGLRQIAYPPTVIATQWK